MRSVLLAAALLMGSVLPVFAQPIRPVGFDTSIIRVAAPLKPGPGVVWVNTDTKTYHCFGSQFYNNTKVGTFMTEKDARATGNKPAGDKVCGT
jgi:hypothetical protein